MTRTTLLRRATVAAAALALVAGVGVPAAEAAPRSRKLDPTSTLALQVPGISSGDLGGAPAVPVRLWDTGTTWAQINPERDVYHWGPLDRSVEAAEAAGAPVLYVLGQTPDWAAQAPQNDNFLPGSTSMPQTLAQWKTWVRTVAQRYQGRIEAYQIWNEASLSTFWTGTPQQMATLTAAAYKIINRVDPAATVVAASTTMRYGFEPWYPTYLSALRAKGWPLDVFAGHFYPPSRGTPATRSAYIEKFRTTLTRYGAPNKPIWDTEVNYGIAGPGPRYPDKDITGTKAAIYVAQTYLDSARLAVARSYWYAWVPETELLGITMQPGTPGAKAFETVGKWLGGVRWRGCGGIGPLRVCRIGSGSNRAVIAYSAGGTISWRVDPGLRRACDALGKCRSVSPGTRMAIGTMPLRFTP